MIEAQDLTILATQVFRQCVEDYIHLQHPQTRTKKYIHEAFLSSVDMFWDPEYRLDVFLDEENNPMDIKSFLKLASDRENINMNAFLAFIKSQSITYWKNKYMDTISIPSFLMICNTPYDVRHKESLTFEIDYKNRIISLNKNSSEDNNIIFFNALIEIICFHEEIQIKKEIQKQLAKSFYETFKMNNSFKSELQKPASQVEE